MTPFQCACQVDGSLDDYLKSINGLLRIRLGPKRTKEIGSMFAKDDADMGYRHHYMESCLNESHRGPKDVPSHWFTGVYRDTLRGGHTHCFRCACRQRVSNRKPKGDWKNADKTKAGKDEIARVERWKDLLHTHCQIKLCDGCKKSIKEFVYGLRRLQPSRDTIKDKNSIKRAFSSGEMSKNKIRRQLPAQRADRPLENSGHASIDVMESSTPRQSGLYKPTDDSSASLQVEAPNLLQETSHKLSPSLKDHGAIVQEADINAISSPLLTVPSETSVIPGLAIQDNKAVQDVDANIFDNINKLWRASSEAQNYMKISDFEASLSEDEFRQSLQMITILTTYFEQRVAMSKAFRGKGLSATNA